MYAFARTEFGNLFPWFVVWQSIAQRVFLFSLRRSDGNLTRISSPWLQSFWGVLPASKSIRTFYSTERGIKPPTKAETRTNVLKERRRVLKIDLGAGILKYDRETYLLGIGNGRL